MAFHKLSITELSNSLTTNIDLASPEGIVKIFRQIDAQMFNGWDTYDSLSDEEILKKIRKAVDAAAEILSNKGKKAIILSGAGTSGRLSMFLARNFNRIAQKYGADPCFKYMIAGGDLALIRAQEGAEDDPLTAQKELKEVVGDAEKILYIGVTCGFSAAYVAGQLDYTSDRENYYSVLLGFNPPELARKLIIEHWDKTFFDIVQKIKDHPRCVLLNPVVGPEAITGSTRMKGGSATKLLIEVVFTAALIKAGFIPKHDLVPKFEPYFNDLDALIFNMVREYENTRVDTYKNLDDIARLVNLGGLSLKAEKHIYYIGNDVYGALGTVDASECPPTFGAAFEDVRGYLPGGWKELLNTDKDLSDAGKEYHISVNDFKEEKLPHLAQEDIVVILGKEQTIEENEELLEHIKNMEAKLGAVLINPVASDFPGFDAVVKLDINPPGFFIQNEMLAEYAVKLVINALTTGAHILDGKVYHNRMIDLNISNTKLYYRTIDIIKEILGVDTQTAVESLLKSIYQADHVTKAQRKQPISAHINEATWRKRRVPRAMLMATGKYNFKEACEAIDEDPVVRSRIEEEIANSQKEK